MKKNILLLLVVCMLSGSLVGCNTKVEASNSEITEEDLKTEYTVQQLAFIDTFNELVYTYECVKKGFDVSPHIENQKLVDIMDDISIKIDEIEVACNDPEFLTLEVMKFYGMAFDSIYIDLNEVAGYLI